MDTNLRDEIHELISKKTEGIYWDFKQEWHSNNSDLIHDIICMANSPANRDCYIIIGIEDKTSKILGIKENNRKNQQNIIDLLRNKPAWAGGYIPDVYLQTVLIDEKEIDVIIIFKSDNTPYYLLTDYKDGKGQPIYRGSIYTRKGDTNTPKTATADVSDVEVLWKRRFGLLYNPSQRASFYLRDLENWERIDGEKDKFGVERFLFYYKFDPDYTVHLEYDEDEDELHKSIHDVNQEMIDERYYYLFSFCNISYHTDFSNIERIVLFYRDIPLFTTNLETIDEGRTKIVPPEYVSNPYYIEDSLRFQLFEFAFYYLCKNYSMEAKEMFLRVIPLYKNESEYNNFTSHIRECGFKLRFKCEFYGEALRRFEMTVVNQSDSIDAEMKSRELLNDENLVENFSSKENVNRDAITRYLKIGKMLVDWLGDWRKNNVREY